MIRASREENRWTQWGQYDTENDAKKHWSRLKMLRTFNPDDSTWKQKIISRGNIVFASALADLITD